MEKVNNPLVDRRVCCVGVTRDTKKKKKRNSEERSNGKTGYEHQKNNTRFTVFTSVLASISIIFPRGVTLAPPP